MFDLPKYGEGVCLARMARLLDALSIDRTRLQRNSVVITGSNGKGSTAALCAGIGRASGLRTGMFTSPHLYRFNKRFQIDGMPIDDDTLTALVKRVESQIADLSLTLTNGSFGAFEAQFALACLYFQEMDCSFAVFEAGIGGRYDPVRLVGALVTCVTSVDYEHVNLLGHSLELIASDKSDACAAGGTIIYGENCHGLQRHLAEYNRNRDVTSLYVRDQIGIGNESASAAGQTFDLTFDDHEFRSIELNLPGSFQINNAAIAATLFLLWLKQPRTDVASTLIEMAVRSGLRETKWPGRLEIIARSPLAVIDVGHTPDAVRQAMSGLRDIHGAAGWVLVLGVSQDKNVQEIAAQLAPAFDSIVCTRAYHKGADAETIATAVRHINPAAEVHVAPTIEQAVQLSRTLAQSTNRRIYVAGGLFVAIEYATALRGARAQDLQFF